MQAHDGSPLHTGTLQALCAHARYCINDLYITLLGCAAE